jgi:hypothetical protein
MRRAPQLWEQRLARTTAILGAGISSSGDATAIVPPSAPPGAGGGTEPAPVAPAPGLFIAPSAPTLIGAVQGINVVWNGLNSAGDLWPSDTSYVEVHMSTAGTGFTPDASTLKGRLARPGGLAVVGLTSGVTYHFRLRGADPAGNFTSAGAAASGTPGLINAPDIAANAINANTIVAGTITGWDINSAYLSGGTVSGGFITGGTIEGASLRTASSGARVEMGSAFGVLSAIQFFSSAGSHGSIGSGIGSAELLLAPGSGGRIYLNGSTFVNNTLEVNGLIDGTSLDISGANVDLPGASGNTGATTADAGFNGNRLRAKTSSQNIKYDISTVDGTLEGVDEARQVDVVTVDPADVLTLGVAEFSWLEQGEPTEWRELGFIAQDVAAKFPIAASVNENGEAIAVRDTPLIAALLAVVRNQQTELADLRTRIEALEA